MIRKHVRLKLSSTEVSVHEMESEKVREEMPSLLHRSFEGYN
jgi:hypothetical protein